MTVTTRPIMFLAWRESTRYYYDSESPTNHKVLMDADPDGNVLRERVNAYHAQPHIIRFERGHRFEIPPFAMESQHVHSGGGGCDYRAQIVIRPAPTLTLGERNAA